MHNQIAMNEAKGLLKVWISIYWNVKECEALFPAPLLPDPEQIIFRFRTPF